MFLEMLVPQILNIYAHMVYFLDTKNGWTQEFGWEEFSLAILLVLCVAPEVWWFKWWMKIMVADGPGIWSCNVCSLGKSTVWRSKAVALGLVGLGDVFKRSLAKLLFIFRFQFAWNQATSWPYVGDEFIIQHLWRNTSMHQGQKYRHRSLDSGHSHLNNAPSPTYYTVTPPRLGYEIRASTQDAYPLIQGE